MIELTHPESVKADPQCPLQTLSVPSSDNPTSWYMETYAREQHLWMRDFAEVLDKMMTNGYPDGASWPVVDQWTDVSCSPRGAAYSQCWHDCQSFSDQEVVIESKLDLRVLQVNVVSCYFHSLWGMGIKQKVCFR